MNGISVSRKQGGNIYAAHRQWASRPADECFKTVDDLDAFCQSQYDNSYEADVDLREVEVIESAQVHNDIVLNVPNQGECEFTNFSFKQFCTQVGAPSDYLAKLPAHLVATNLNYGIEKRVTDGKDSKMLFYQAPKSETGDRTRLYTRAATSQLYDRIWNADISLMLKCMDQDKIGPPASASGGNGTGTGLYASDKDMFAFLVAKNKYVDVSGAELVRGFYIANNEVGTGSLKLCLILCDYVCMNHIIWNVKDAIMIQARHVGTTASDIMREALPLIIAMAMSDKVTQLQEARLRTAQTVMLGTKKEQVVDLMFEKRLTTRKLAAAAYESAELRHATTGHCDPMSVWGMVCGLTAEAKKIAYYDQRELVENSAAKLMDLAA